MGFKLIELQPIKETTEDYERLEELIKKWFREHIYIPLLEEIGYKPKALQNSTDDLISAIQRGQISFYRGIFSGRFNAAVSRELKKIGAEWDRKLGVFRIPSSKLSTEMKSAIELSQSRIQQKFQNIDKKLSEILPAKIADKLKMENIFDTTLFKINKSFAKTVKGITVAPKLSDDQRKRIAKEYTENMDKYIQDFTKEEIVKLRKRVQKQGLKGFRYESLVKDIQKSYGVSESKAKFLARQETSLMMTKFKETRYQAAGVNEYRWKTVVGSPNHPVRPMHKALDGKIFRWDNPPVTSEDGKRNNPGQDYNCRCFAVPIVRFKK